MQEQGYQEMVELCTGNCSDPPARKSCSIKEVMLSCEQHFQRINKQVLVWAHGWWKCSKIVSLFHLATRAAMSVVALSWSSCQQIWLC